MSITVYEGERTPYYYNVSYVVIKTGARLVTSFDSPYSARKFVNKLKRSKTCVLTSYPIFN